MGKKCIEEEIPQLNTSVIVFLFIVEMFSLQINNSAREQELHVSVEWEKDIDPSKSIVIQGKIESMAAQAQAK